MRILAVYKYLSRDCVHEGPMSNRNETLVVGLEHQNSQWQVLERVHDEGTDMGKWVFLFLEGW